MSKVKAFIKKQMIFITLVIGIGVGALVANKTMTPTQGEVAKRVAIEVLNAYIDSGEMPEAPAE